MEIECGTTAPQTASAGEAASNHEHTPNTPDATVLCIATAPDHGGLLNQALHAAQRGCDVGQPHVVDELGRLPQVAIHLKAHLRGNEGRRWIGAMTAESPICSRKQEQLATALHNWVLALLPHQLPTLLPTGSCCVGLPPSSNNRAPAADSPRRHSRSSAPQQWRGRGATPGPGSAHAAPGRGAGVREGWVRPGGRNGRLCSKAAAGRCNSTSRREHIHPVPQQPMAEQVQEVAAAPGPHLGVTLQPPRNLQRGAVLALHTQVQRLRWDRAQGCVCMPNECIHAAARSNSTAAAWHGCMQDTNPCRCCHSCAPPHLHAAQQQVGGVGVDGAAQHVVHGAHSGHQVSLACGVGHSHNKGGSAAARNSSLGMSVGMYSNQVALLMPWCPNSCCSPAMAPASTSLCPARYLVAEWITRSAPRAMACRQGMQRAGGWSVPQLDGPTRQKPMASQACMHASASAGRTPPPPPHLLVDGRGKGGVDDHHSTLGGAQLLDARHVHAAQVRVGGALAEEQRHLQDQVPGGGIVQRRKEDNLQGGSSSSSSSAATTGLAAEGQQKMSEP